MSLATLTGRWRKTNGSGILLFKEKKIKVRSDWVEYFLLDPGGDFIAGCSNNGKTKVG